MTRRQRLCIMLVVSAGFLAIIAWDYRRAEKKEDVPPAKVSARQKIGSMIGALLIDAYVHQDLGKTKREKMLKRLDDLQTARAGRLHWNGLNDVFEDVDEREMILECESALQESMQEVHFSEKDELMRIKIIDYLGEKWIGRIDTSMRLEIQKIFAEQLALDVLSGDFEEQKQKSLIGDKIDIIQYMARANPAEAMANLSIHPYAREQALLDVGIKNGLWLKGMNETQIDHLYSTYSDNPFKYSPSG